MRDLLKSEKFLKDLPAGTLLLSEHNGNGIINISAGLGTWLPTPQGIIPEPLQEILLANPNGESSFICIAITNTTDTKVSKAIFKGRVEWYRGHLDCKFERYPLSKLSRKNIKVLDRSDLPLFMFMEKGSWFERVLKGEV